MSEKKNTPTPRRPRKQIARRKLTSKQFAQRFIVVTGIVVFSLSLIVSMLAGLQGNVAGSPVVNPSPTSTPSESASPEASMDAQTALKFQAAAIALYLAQGIEDDDPAVTLKTKILPPQLASGETAPNVVVPVSFRITEGQNKELIVCARAAVPGGDLVDEYFIFPVQYELERPQRCPQESPTALPLPASTPSLVSPAPSR